MSATLCVDLGNSHTVIGLFQNGKVIESWRINTLENSTSDELFLRLGTLLDLTGVDWNEIHHVGLASVIPSMERPWAKAIQKLLRRTPTIISSDHCLGMPIRYDQPRSLGVDRICNVVGLSVLGYESAIALDLGTATTFDILWENGFHGGCILPGINASMEVLTGKASRLVSVSLEWPENVIATNTEDALRSGLLNGYVGQIEALVAAIRKELQAPDLEVVATGGWSTILSERCPAIKRFDPHLTLRGIKAIAESDVHSQSNDSNSIA